MRTYTRRNTIKESIGPIEGVLGLCRLCLEEVGTNESIPIFANKSDIYTSLATRIMMCAGYEITWEDCLPNAICTGCLTELNNYYEFRKKCTTTYHRLKSHVFAVQTIKANDVKHKPEEIQKPSFSEDADKSSVSSTDQLVLVFNEIPQLGNVGAESSRLQNSSDNSSIPDLNGLTNGTEIKGVKESDQTNPVVEVCPDVADFLSSILLEMGILKNQEGELTENCRTIQIETGDTEEITFEMLEIEEEQANTATDKPGNAKRKTKNEVSYNDRPRCAECGRRFATWGVLQRHRRTHTGERPHRCAHCNRAFAQRAVLRRHELVHQEVRPFACTSCPKSFTQRGALAAHARRHAAPGARALALHRCTKCPKVFLHASGLSRHAISHSGRMFACPLCGRCFSDNSSLRRHQRTKHEPPQEI